MKSISMTLIASLALTACTTYVGPETVSRLGEAPTLSGGTFSSGGGITVAADIREQNGRTLLCGVWAQSEAQSVLTKGRARDVMTKGSVRLDGVQIAQQLSFMREVEPDVGYGGSSANCRLIDRPWQAGDEGRDLTIRIPRHVVYREYDDGGGIVVVFFNPAGPGAGGG